MNEEAVRHLPASPQGCRAVQDNFFALGLKLWLYDRPIQPVLEYLIKKFRKNLSIMAANSAEPRAGYNYADTAELFRVQHTVAAAKLPKGRYRRVTGNEAAALGLVAAAHKAGRTLVYAGLSITPASEILHELSKYKDYDVRTLQVEDEIAAVVAGIGASFAGAIGVTGTSGPGLALKVEGLGLAVMTELPMVIFDVQRAGPSTGMPTKTEQSDLLMAVHGRHAGAAGRAGRGHSRRLLRHRLRGDSPRHQVHDAGDRPLRQLPLQRRPTVADRRSRGVAGPAHSGDSLARAIRPLSSRSQDPARPWVSPGTPHYEHRIGGLEKTDITGGVSYDAMNHQRMVNLLRGKDRTDCRRHSARDRQGLGQGRSAGRELGQHLRFRGGGGQRPAGGRSFG